MKIRHAKIAEKATIEKYIRRVEAAASFDGVPRPLWGACAAFDFGAAIEKDRVYIAIENRMIYGLLIVSNSVLDSYFAESHSREKELNMLLKTDPKGYEEIVIIESLSIDPRFRGKGFGKELTRYVTDNHRHGLVIAAVPPKNEKAVRYFRDRGFLARGTIEPEGQEPRVQILLSWRLHERTATYRAHDSSRL